MRRDREHKIKRDRRRTENTLNTDIKRQRTQNEKGQKGTENAYRKGIERDREHKMRRDRMRQTTPNENGQRTQNEHK